MKSVFFFLVLVFLSFPVAAEQTEHEYQRVTITSLSDLYWAIDMLDLDNETHLDNYMKINECEMYTEFYRNEFEWKGLRDAVKASLVKGKMDLPTRYEYMQKIHLDDYDFETGKFSIYRPYQIDRIYRFEIQAQDFHNSVCTEGRFIEGYPPGIVVSLNRPFSLSEIPVPKDIASAYVAEKAKALDGMNERQLAGMERHERRDAYLVLQFNITGFDKVLEYSSTDLLAQVNAELDGYEVYGDVNGDMLLYKHKMPPPKRIYKGPDATLEVDP